MELIDKAQTILNNKNLSDQLIGDEIGVSRMTIHNYRTGANKLENAKYSMVKALADEYDKNEITMIDMANTGAFKYFIATMQAFFEEIEQDQQDSYNSEEAYADDLALIPVIQRINKEVSNNTSLLIELYNIYYENLDHKKK